MQDLFVTLCVIAIFAFVPVSVAAMLIIDRTWARPTRKNLGPRPVHEPRQGVQ